MTPEELDCEIDRVREIERAWLEAAVRDGFLPASALERYQKSDDVSPPPTAS